MKIQTSNVFTDVNQESNSITVKGKEVGKRKFSAFRTQVSADINSVDINVNASSIIRVDGTQMSAEEQLKLLASYQTAQLERNVQRVVDSVERFLSNPDFEVNVRYVSHNVDPSEKAREWVKASLYHGLCGIGNSFTHDGVNYRVISSTQSYTITGKQASDVISGAASINLKGLSGETLVPGKDLFIVIDKSLLESAMSEVIQQLSISVSDGRLYIRGVCVREWKQNVSINVEASSGKLSDVSINI